MFGLHLINTGLVVTPATERKSPLHKIKRGSILKPYGNKRSNPLAL
ncbi:DNA polymerase II large subunit [Bienertia sinuspersici]